MKLSIMGIIGHERYRSCFSYCRIYRSGVINFRNGNLIINHVSDIPKDRSEPGDPKSRLSSLRLEQRLPWTCLDKEFHSAKCNSQ